MGGFGSGGRRHGGRRTVGSTQELRVADLRKWGAFDDAGIACSVDWSWGGRTPGRVVWTVDRGKRFLSLECAYETVRADRMQCHDRFELSFTRPGFGGRRWWIVCNCGRRVTVLVRPTDSPHFRCRRCHRLNYESQHENAEGRAFRQARRVLERVSPAAAESLVRADLIDLMELPPRPKGMRRRTYLRHVADWNHWTRVYRGHAALVLGRLFEVISRP